MKRILVTGGAGFIGANFVNYFLNHHAEAEVINLDALTYAGDLSNLREVEQNPRHLFIKGDILDRPLLETIFQQHDISSVIHFAAESHVDNSISGPETFIRTNVLGTFTVLDVARRNWMDVSFKFKTGKEKNRFLHISTDEVYGSLGQTGLFTEETSHAPNSPYSASKAGSDMI